MADESLRGPGVAATSKERELSKNRQRTRDGGQQRRPGKVAREVWGVGFESVGGISGPTRNNRKYKIVCTK